MRIMSGVPQGADDVTLTLWLSTDRTYNILAADEPDSNKVVIGTVVNPALEGSNYWTDTNVLNETSQRFYNISASTGGVSSAYTNTADWAMYAQNRLGGTTNEPIWHMMSVPVELASGNNNLNAGLGSQLAIGLTPGSTYDDADRIAVWDPVSQAFSNYYLWTGDTNWYDESDNPADVVIEPGTALWVLRRNGSGVGTKTVFTGLVRTNSQYQVTVRTGWNMLSWPYAIPRHESDYAGTDREGWGFLADGGIGSNTFRRLESDNVVFVGPDGKWEKFYLVDGVGAPHGAAVNGRWWDDFGALDTNGYRFANWYLRAGEGFYYYHVGTSFTWSAEK
jgi:hypothetical protein